MVSDRESLYFARSVRRWSRLRQGDGPVPQLCREAGVVGLLVRAGGLPLHEVLPGGEVRPRRALRQVDERVGAGLRAGADQAAKYGRLSDPAVRVTRLLREVGRDDAGAERRARQALG